ncbi:hypothetical protein [Barnesiella intestinihominis]|uniref:hypothetical protein n=1 Tax=Barnesiella intestinihominis TaxID=487174 RepID=UPI002665DA59|nr:hypothetical protein [Barnesiella intestinihominis]
MRHIVFLSLFLAVLAATSCTKHVYVPVETTKSDTVYMNRVQLDSIYMRDSVFIEKSGDTIREFQYKYIYRFKDRIDTLYISKTDSIQVPYPVEVVKYKTPQWCWWALGGIVLLLVPYIVKWIMKLKGLGFLI